MRLLLVSLFVLISVQLSAQTTIKTVTIDPYKSLSYGAFFKSLTLHSEDTHAEYIDGFEFEWGYTYELKLKSTKLTSPPEDGSDTDYALIKEISKTKAPDDYRFELRLENEVYLGGDSAEALTEIDDSSYMYLREIKIVVPEELQEEFQQVIEQGKSKVGVFGFNDDGSIQLYEIK
ncbi:MAG: hypothetical protein Crog4KO_34260 [Crocinitomicaceae bacterium]